MINYLSDRTVYLAGPMFAASDDGVGWRQVVTPTLQVQFNLHVEDPSKKTVSGVGEIGTDKDNFKKLILSEKWVELKRDFYPIVRKDLRCVDRSDFLIVVYDPCVHMFGTIHEIVLASQQKKPILIKYEKKDLDSFNPWVTCLVKPQWLFSEWDDMFSYLYKINDGKIETSHWGLD